MGIYDFRTNKISLVTDETLTTGCFDRIVSLSLLSVPYHSLSDGMDA